MTIEDRIYEALAPLVGGRVLRDLATEPTERPYITFQQVGGLPYDYLEGAVGAADNGRFQVNVWADSRDEAAQVARDARRALVESADVRATTASGLVALYEPAVGLYGTRQDFSITFPSS